MSGTLHAGALCVDDGAAASSGGAGCVHDGAGVALIGNDEQQLIAGILQGAFLLQCKGLVFGQELQRPLAADAADRDDERDAGARHINAHFAAQVFLQAGPGLGGDHGKEHGLFGLLQPQGGKGLPHRRACTHRAQADRDAVLLVKGQKGIGGVAVGDGDEPV